MGSQTWKNRVIPPLIVVTVVGGVWYSAAHKEDPIKIPSTVASASEQTPKQTIVPKVNPEAAATMPTVKKISGQVQLSVNTAKVARVQKVEFYVGSKLVGASYSSPYSVSLDENSLQPGSHQVTAKIYTPETTSETAAASFTSQQGDSTAVTPQTNTNNGSTTTTDNTPSQDTTMAVAPGNPVNVNAIEQTNDSVVVSWDPPIAGSQVVSYQVWRDTTQLDTTVGTTYTDSTVIIGTTYTYKIIAVDAEGNTSEPTMSSAITATEMSPANNQIPPPESQAQTAAPAKTPDNTTTQ